MAEKTSYFHPYEPNAQSFECGADSLLGRLSICPLLGAESIGFTTKYKALARLQGIRSIINVSITYYSKCIGRGERKTILIVEHSA